MHINCTNHNILNDITKQLCNKYKMTVKGEPSYMLGIKISHDKINQTIKLDQKQQILDLLKEYKLDDVPDDIRSPERPYARI